MIQVIGLIWSLCICLHPSIVEATTNIILVRGNKMYDSKTGERFFIKGVSVVVYFVYFVCKIYNVLSSVVDV
jgi:hypothetical protein